MSHKLSYKQSFFTQIPAGPVSVLGDRDALRRALLILLDNAVRYTPEGGNIRVEVTTQSGCAVATVADTGIGLAADDLRNVFDRFWRADKARSREGGGAGLGLSIAKWIVETHKGKIGMTSKLGQGSQVYISIPVET